MVLQRDMPVPVWGTAKPGAKITVTFGQQEKTAETGKDGKWLVRLDALKASAEPAQLTVKSLTGDQPVTIADVLVGDVWFCSGQSNMEWVMKQFKTEEDVGKAVWHVADTKVGYAAGTFWYARPGATSNRGPAAEEASLGLPPWPPRQNQVLPP
jgi:hypothetical protein